MKSIIVFVSILVSVVLTYYAYLFAPKFVDLVGLVVYRVFDVFFGYWSLQHIVFALSLGTVPIIALISWLIRGHNRLRSLLVLNLIAGGMIVSFVLIVALLMIFFGSRGIPKTVQQPNVHFWNYVFILSSFCTTLILLVFSSITAKRYKLKSEMGKSEGQIDQ